MALYPCVICGDLVEWSRREKYRWKSEFRTVTADPGIQEPTLSAVGHVNLDADFRPQYQLPNGELFQMEGNPHSRFRDLDVGRHSFIMHDTCYSLLAQFLHPKPIPVARLLEACRSCPILCYSTPYLSWSSDHDYGGMILLSNYHPWDEPDVITAMDKCSGHGDPWSIPELIQRLKSLQLDASAKQTKRKRSRKAGRSTWKRRKRWSARLTTARDIASNYFTKLPLEVLEYILAYTHTDGVKSLAQTSRGLNIIIPSRLGQHFWASRFQNPFEYGYVFEAWTYRIGLDWKSLYFSIKKDTSPTLQNRQRIWGLIQSLSELISVQLNGGQALLPLSRDEKELKWKEVQGLFQPPEDGQDPYGNWTGQGCLRLYSQCTSIPTLLCRITVSIVSIGRATYVTGLSFISNQETEICLGYTSRRKLSLETTGLQGFIIAVGTRGIHAVQCVTPTGQLSQWFGNPNGMPITRRLVSYKPLTALKADFDGFKMVSLAIAETSSPALDSPLNETTCLRDNALWFPSIPESHLQFNETNFSDINTALSGFRPLCCLFGDATNPTKLAKVLVTVSETCKTLAIDCYYDNGNVRRLGGPDYSTFHTETSGYLVFRTAGEDKDTITFVENGELRPPKVDEMPNIRRDRICPPNVFRRSSLLSPLRIPSGSSLVCLYAQWDENALSGLGVMTKSAHPRAHKV